MEYSSEWGRLFRYKGFWGIEAHCYVKVNRNVVICTEAPDNNGTSITNMAEQLALLVCDAYNIPLDDLTWIEHYPESYLPENYSLVEFSILERFKYGGFRFYNPKWSPITKDEVERIYESG